MKFQLCQEAARNRNLKKEDLIEGTAIVSGLSLVLYALDYDGMLSF